MTLILDRLPRLTMPLALSAGSGLLVACLGCGRVDNSAIAPTNPEPPPKNVSYEAMQGSKTQVPAPPPSN